MSLSKPKTFNVKQSQRNEAKKRKLEAFLNLVKEDEMGLASPKKKPVRTFSESYKALKDELKKYQKKEVVDADFFLNERGQKALLKYSTDNGKPICVSPLFVEDVHHLLLKSVLGNYSKFPVPWAKVQKANSITKTLLIEIKGLSDHFLKEFNAALNDVFSLPYTVDVLSSGNYFSAEVCNLLSEEDLKGKFSSMFPMSQKSSEKTELNNEKYSVSKLHLLLSPIQLAMEHYPLPQSVFEQSQTQGYCFSKSAYSPVNADSPMFAVDCEMCRVASGKQEVTRIAVVNEDLETVYHTFVKPKEQIIDYATKYSGITEKMLRDVKTTLKDVYNDLQNLLPPDAILCGQSLNCDLHALKMIHPYVIDTSVIYNENGIRHQKSSLKSLAKVHLKETIQSGKNGHNPVEDSIATMKLVQLKLKRSVSYGDAVLSSDADMGDDTKVENNPEISESDPKTNSNGLFSLVSRFSKKTCLIGDENFLSNFNQETNIKNVTLVNKSSVEEIANTTVENLKDKDFIISHLTLDPENISVSNLKDEIIKLYNSCLKNTMIIIVTTETNQLSDESLVHNFCTIVLKK